MQNEFLNTDYCLICVGVMVLAFGVFFFSYEKKKPQAREVVTLAVMSAIAVASRAAFIMVPFFKPMTGIVMIAGMAFGPGAGFLVGAVSAFVSNFIFGQGPWTPWQMFAYAAAGLVAGWLYKHDVIHESKKILTSFMGLATVVLIVGPILDTCSVFTMGNVITLEYAISIYGSGLIPNLIHGAATFLTLLLLGKPMMEKLNRMKVKYGMMDSEEDDEI